MSDITDLDVFVGSPRKASLAGVEYLFPRDIPAEIYLEVLRLQQNPGELDDQAAVLKLRDELVELLQVYQPELTKLPASFSIPIVVRAIGAIYRDADEQAEAAATDPTPAASRGKSTSRKPRSRSSSS